MDRHERMTTWSRVTPEQLALDLPYFPQRVEWDALDLQPRLAAIWRFATSRAATELRADGLRDPITHRGLVSEILRALDDDELDEAAAYWWWKYKIVKAHFIRLADSKVPYGVVGMHNYAYRISREIARREYESPYNTAVRARRASRGHLE